MAPKEPLQIFQTNNPTRWQRFKWGGRFILFLMLMAVAVVTIAIKNLYLPDLPQVRGQVMKEVLQSDKPTTELAKELPGF